jgi:hypothetical protein
MSAPPVSPARLRACIYEGPRSAVWPLAEALGIEPEDALEILRALVGAGFVVAPRVPTDAMLVAYFDAYGERAYTPNGIVRGIGKARKRWDAMGRAGTAVALSRRHAPAQGGVTRMGGDGEAGSVAEGDSTRSSEGGCAQ